MRPLLYLDSSAILKLIFDEPESEALSVFLASPCLPVSSTLARLEIARIVGRVRDPTATREAAQVMRGVNLIRIDDRILAAAAVIEPTGLRTLDAIHLATAQSLGDQLAGIVVYDQRLAVAARQCGLTTWTPR